MFNGKINYFYGHFRVILSDLTGQLLKHRGQTPPGT